MVITDETAAPINDVTDRCVEGVGGARLIQGRGWTPNRLRTSQRPFPMHSKRSTD